MSQMRGGSQPEVNKKAWGLGSRKCVIGQIYDACPTPFLPKKFQREVRRARLANPIGWRLRQKNAAVCGKKARRAVGDSL